jgi:hypothetical protein
VVEHSIGNGEVDSSILSGSTSFFHEINVGSEAPSPSCCCRKERSF